MKTIVKIIGIPVAIGVITVLAIWAALFILTGPLSRVDARETEGRGSDGSYADQKNNPPIESPLEEFGQTNDERTYTQPSTNSSKK